MKLTPHEAMKPSAIPPYVIFPRGTFNPQGRCIGCGDRFGYEVPIITTKDAPTAHLSCWYAAQGKKGAQR